MQLTAETVFINGQAFLKLPENFKIKDKQPMLAHQNPTTGQVSIYSYLPEWQEFLDAWQQLDGTEWELPRYEYAIERPDLFAD